MIAGAPHPLIFIHISPMLIWPEKGESSLHHPGGIIAISAGSRRGATDTPGNGSPKRGSTPAGVPAADVPPSTFRGGYDPCQGREHSSRFTGGLVAALLNPRLMAVDPSGMCKKLRVSPSGPAVFEIPRRVATTQSKVMVCP